MSRTSFLLRLTCARISLYSQIPLEPTLNFNMSVKTPLLPANHISRSLLLYPKHFLSLTLFFENETLERDIKSRVSMFYFWYGIWNNTVLYIFTCEQKRIMYFFPVLYFCSAVYTSLSPSPWERIISGRKEIIVIPSECGGERLRRGGFPCVMRRVHACYRWFCNVLTNTADFEIPKWLVQ